ncbi:MAG TPA: formate dehydrogenase accessory protein FdhE [Candidatus Acidoferrum sp.]|jgi:FdhE protein|nr:formate dehydrogenase accessory protein FdhE [Candidatus Acidoferrum sp.]
MMAGQAGGAEYDARIGRAEHLRSRHPAATEFLTFYEQVASFQKLLRAKISAVEAKPEGAVPAELRAELDLIVLLPHFRGYLSVVENHAPRALAESARQFALLPSESWIASLEAYWQCAGRYDQQVGAFAEFLPRAFLEPYAEFRAALVPRAPLVATTRLCPLCGSRPLVGVLRPEGDGGKRFLLCSFCLQEWEFRRILCPACGEEAEDKLPVFIAEDSPYVRVEACDTCKFYLRTIDLTKDGNAVPLVDDLAALPHTLWAHEQGYSRIQANLLGT